MQKQFITRRKQYIVMLFILLCSFIAIIRAYHDVRGNSIEAAKQNISEDVSLFTTYFTDVLDEKLINLEYLSHKIDNSALADEVKLEKLFSEYYRYFSALSVLNRDGNLLYGEKTNRDISQEDAFHSVIREKKTVIYDGILSDEANKKYIAAYTPIEDDGKTIGVLQGNIYLSELDDFLEKEKYLKSDVMFIMNEQGEYVSGTVGFREIMGENSESFYDYLAKCDMKSDISSVSDMENAVEKGQAVAIEYRRKNVEYIGVLQPLERGPYYIGYLSNTDHFNQIFTLQQGTKFIIALSLIFWLIWVLFFIYLAHSREKIGNILERYKVIHENEHSLIFDFSFSPKKLQFFGDMERMFGYNTKLLRGEAVYEIYNYIHKDDASVRGRIHQFYDDDREAFSTEVRIIDADGKYGWYRITGVLIKDKRWGINCNFVGKVESANQQIAKEKNLIERSENDLLTGVLNKKTMEEKVIKCLENIQGGNRYIFFMIDLDNFKNVNDKLGHIIGDRAIVDTAERLKEVFHDNAYIGRLGGDEFAVCVSYDAFDDESLQRFIRNKADKICEVNRRTYMNGDREVHITSSVGIAIAPDFAKDFETIYKMADSALYHSKNGGKNCWNIYQVKK